MDSATHRPECTADAVLYVAFELASKEWLLTMSVSAGAPRRRTRVRAGDREQIVAALAAAKRRFGLAADAAVRSCYEAGRDGFWPDPHLRFLFKNSIVRCHASLAAAASKRGVVSLLNPCCVPG